MAKKVIGILFVLVVILGIAGAGLGYMLFISPNINSTKPIIIKIPTGSTYNDVLQILRDKKALKNEWTFDLVANYKNYLANIKPGNYILTRKMDNRQLINVLRAGLQSPVTLVIYNIQTKEQFTGLVGRTLEIDSNQLLAIINSDTFVKKYNLDTNNIISRFIMDNYEFYWNASTQNFFKKMEEGYNAFWNDDRKEKAKDLNLSEAEVMTLASVVEKECMWDKELKTVAGVYLNRIRIGMPLQADPTLKFALRDFDAKRVKGIHLSYDSPYNTYKYKGIPPGPICIPKKKAIDAVLNAEKHEYLYFVANSDMSGYSVFSKNLADHEKARRLYIKKLNEMNIH
jgi:UPF0755 protein